MLMFLRIFLVMFSSILACCTYSGSRIHINKHEAQDHTLIVIMEKYSDYSKELITSNTFEVLASRNDSIILNKDEWEKRVPPNSGPSPFSPTSTFPFNITDQDSVCLQLYDSEDVLVAHLFKGVLSEGAYLLRFKLPTYSDFPAGIYFCALEIGAEKKLIRWLVLIN
jgi:hypothetical protein